MVELFVLALLALVGLSVAAIVGFVLLVIKMVVWTVLLPLRLLFKLIWLPFGLAFGAIGMTLGVIALPIVCLLLAGFLIVGLITAFIGLMIPAIPFVLLGLLLWSIFRQRPAVAGGTALR